MNTTPFMTLSPTIEAMCAAATRRLHKAIDKRTASRSVGQLYRDRAAEAKEAALRG
jgi:hypothetical protein